MTITEPALPPSAAVPRQRDPRPEPAATLGSVRIPHAAWIVLGGCVLAFAGLLYLSRNQDFFGDEWDFVVHAQNWTLRDYLVPHNEHWSTLPMLSYKALLTIFGMSSYLPFSVALLLVHTASAFVLFLVVRRQAGDLVGLAAAGLLLVVAHGSENVFWAFQIGFVGSILFGLIAIYLLLGPPPTNRRRPALASAALVASLACSGVGMFFIPIVAVDLWLDRKRRGLLWVLAAPVAAYGLWFLSFGRAKATVHRSPLEADLLRELVTYVPTGVGSGLAGMVSLASHFGLVALAAGSAVFALMLHRVRPLPTLATGAAVGLTLQYTVTGLVRAQFGDVQAMSSRYIYIATALGLLIFAPALARLPFVGLWRPAVLVVVAGILVHDTTLIVEVATERAAAQSTLEARLQTAWLLRDAPDFDPTGTPDPYFAPTMRAGDYVRAREAFGAQYPEITIADLPTLDPAAVNEALRAVLPLDLTVVSAAPPDGTCQNLDPEAPFVRIPATDGTRLWFVSTSTFPLQMHVNHWLLGDTVDGPAVVHSIEPGEILMITVADSGQGLDRQLQVSSAPGTLGTVCHAPAS